MIRLLKPYQKSNVVKETKQNGSNRFFKGIVLFLVLFIAAVIFMLFERERNAGESGVEKVVVRYKNSGVWVDGKALENLNIMEVVDRLNMVPKSELHMYLDDKTKQGLFYHDSYKAAEKLGSSRVLIHR